MSDSFQPCLHRTGRRALQETTKEVVGIHALLTRSLFLATVFRVGCFGAFL